MRASGLPHDDVERDATHLVDAMNAREKRDEQLTQARLLRQIGQLRDAEEAYRQLLAMYPHDAVIALEAGELADEVGAVDIAMARLRRAVLLSGVMLHEALPALARALMHAGRFEQAGRCWWRLARAKRSRLLAWSGLLVCAMAAERQRLARIAMTRLMRLGDRQRRRQCLAQHWRHVAAARAAITRPTPAVMESPLRTLLEKSVATLTVHAERFPRRADTFYHLAMCHEALDARDDAAASVRNALAINENYAAAKRLYRRVA